MKKRLFIITMLLCIAGAFYMTQSPQPAEALTSEVADFQAENAFVDLQVDEAEESAALFSEDSVYENLKAEVLSQMKEFPANGATQMHIPYQGEYDDAQEWANNLFSAYYNTVYDHPEELFFAGTGVAWRIEYKGAGYVATVTPKVDQNILSDAATYQAAVDRACLECFGTTDPSRSGMTALEKITAAHDWLVANCHYDPYAGNARGKASWTSPAGDVYRLDNAVYTSYGAFVNHRAVCQGYALAFKVLMDRAGIPCVYASSVEMSHAWNMVSIGGRWYHVDCAWDDPAYSSVYDYAGHVSRSYFLLSDAEMEAKSHYGWTTEYGCKAPASFSLPYALTRAGEHPVVHDGSQMYVIGTDNVLRTYSTGTGFATEKKSASLNLMPYAAAYDHDNHAFYIGTYSEIYQIDPSNGAKSRFAALGTSGSGLYLRANGDGTGTLSSTYCYQTRQSWIVGQQKATTPAKEEKETASAQTIETPATVQAGANTVTTVTTTTVTTTTTAVSGGTTTKAAEETQTKKEEPANQANTQTFHQTAPQTVQTGSATATTAEPSVMDRLSDVQSSDYYFNPVQWAVEKNITRGTSETTFSPASACTRAQVMTFLWRAEGMPEPASTVNPFQDVNPDAYYYKAVLWAVEKGITTGAGGGNFAPDESCTRSHIVTFLWRYAGQTAPEQNAAFSDVEADAYFAKAVSWAKENNITTGTSNETFSPASACTRGQIVTFLYRYMN